MMARVRFFAVAIAVAAAAACAKTKPKPVANLRLVGVRLSNEYATSPPAHPAPGHTFATVHFTQSAYAPEKYDWIHATAFDAQQHSYRAKYTSETRGSSRGSTPFGTATTEETPSEIDVIFEVPEHVAIATVRVPQEIGVPR